MWKNGNVAFQEIIRNNDKKVFKINKSYNVNYEEYKLNGTLNIDFCYFFNDRFFRGLAC